MKLEWYYCRKCEKKFQGNKYDYPEYCDECKKELGFKEPEFHPWFTKLGSRKE